MFSLILLLYESFQSRGVKFTYCLCLDWEDQGQSLLKDIKNIIRTNRYLLCGSYLKSLDYIRRGVVTVSIWNI